MSGFIKHRPDLFLGVAELNRQQELLGVEGFIRYSLSNSAKFGVIRDQKDVYFKNFKVVEDVHGSGKFKIESISTAIDSSGRLIVSNPVGDIVVPNNGSWYWVKISHEYSVEERGTVSIDAYGSLTGVGTEFLSVLRGQPDFPSRVKLLGSSQNTLDYEVVEVTSDTSALLAGTQFISESGLKYAVVGTYTPGHVITSQDRHPFQYNSCKIELVQETSINTPPLKTDGEEFYIARVRSVGGNLSIHDKRLEIYSTQSESRLSAIEAPLSPLIGVEWVKFSEPSTGRDYNLVCIGFGMRTSSWTLDSTERAIIFSTGVVDAGKYKSTSDFSDGELDRWRIYYKDGTYSTIHTSEKQGTSIKCTVDEVDPRKLTVGDILVVTPPVDSVEIEVLSDNLEKPVIHSITSFSGPAGFGILKLPVPEQIYRYVLRYRYRKSGSTTEWSLLPSDTVKGYYDEQSFDANGNIVATPNRKTYTSSDTVGYIELVRPNNSYIDTVTAIITGDRYGIGEFELDNGDPYKVFQVNQDYMVQKCTGTYTNVPFITDHIIGLSNTGAVNGNSFTFMFIKGLANDGYSLTITSGYIDENTPGTPIYTFRDEDFDYPYLKDSTVIIKCIFTGSQWEAFVIEKDSSVIGDIKMVSNISSSEFTNGKATIGTKYQGWALCDGSNGTLDLRGRFILGFDRLSEVNPYDATTVSHQPQHENFGKIGNVGGLHTVKLEEDQVPLVKHSHKHNISIQHGGSHTHTHNLAVEGGGSHTHKGRRSSMVSTGNGVKVPLTDVPDDGSGGRYDINTTQSNGDGRHTHTLSGGIQTNNSAHTHTVVGGVATEVRTNPVTGGNKRHENKPRYIVVGFIQRVKQ